MQLATFVRRHRLACAITSGLLALVGVLVVATPALPVGSFAVWIEPGMAQPRVHALEASVRATPGVTACAFWSQARDYRAMLALENGQIGSLLSVHSTPAAIRCDATQPVVRRVMAALSGTPGVDVTPTFPLATNPLTRHVAIPWP